MAEITSSLPFLIEQIKLAEVKFIELRAIIDSIIGHTAQKFSGKRVDISTLTKQEMKLVKLIATGKSNAAIADILHVSRRTVEAHRYNIKKKLGIKTKELKELAGLQVEH